MKSYLISENGGTHGFLVTAGFTDKLKADEECTRLNEKYAGYNHKVHEIAVKGVSCKTANYCEDGSTIIVAAKASIDGNDCEAYFHVQTVNGKYNPQLGCQVTTDSKWELGRFSDTEALLYEAACPLAAAEMFLDRKAHGCYLFKLEEVEKT
jgi:hypothetical protein